MWRRMRSSVRMGLARGDGGTIVTSAPEHPLDPLTAEEIRQAAAILRRDRGVGGTWRFASIELKEPAKAGLSALEADPQAAAAKSHGTGCTRPGARSTLRSA